MPCCVPKACFCGRDAVDVHAQANSMSCEVCVCGSVRCKTGCRCLSQGGCLLCRCMYCTTVLLVIFRSRMGLDAGCVERVGMP